MKAITTLGIDLAKNVFQLHGVDEKGAKILVKKLSRKQLAAFVARLPKCTIALEACGGSHFWGRKFQEMGHEVKLISPQFVKPFVKSNKNDANDAEAIVEAALRPSMRFVSVKSIEQQDILGLHRIRERLVCARTALFNEIRGLLGEYGVVVAKGPNQLRKQLPEILEDENSGLSVLGRRMFSRLWTELSEMDEKVKTMDDEIKALMRSNEAAKRLQEVPGVGPLTATAILAAVGDASQFRNGREMSGWLGLVPRQHSSGGKQRLGRISKRGDSYIRKLLIHGARTVLLHVESREDRQAQWLKALVERRGMNRACVALANKNARVLWAMMKNESNYRLAN